jgi:serine protease
MSPSDVAAAITAAYASGADILSNSWGYGFSCPAGGSFDVLSEAIQNATILGRGGRGCPVIFSSGNGSPYISGVLYPACLEAAFSVGATQLDDYRWYYSSYGSALDIVAPSGDVCLQGDVWTLDQMSTIGYNPNVTSACSYSVTWDCPTVGTNDINYDCNFGGTSAACPVVSGTASLILAKDSTLTVDEVYDILKYSAVTDLDWGSLPDTPCVEYGYGRVDAFRAILSISHGDVDNGGSINIGDIAYLVAYLFGVPSGPEPFPSLFLGDVDCDRGVNMGDITYLVDYLCSDGPPPVNPCFEF